MKKLLSMLAIALIITGCSLTEDMSNTPTKQVETYLNNYQTLDDDVLSRLDSIVAKETEFNTEQQDSYREILKDHFKNLTYTIKEETVNGDSATVEVEVEVTDYAEKLKEIEAYRTSNEDEFLDDDGMYSETLFNDYKLKHLSEAEEKVKYTLYFSLSKENDKWILDDLTDDEQQKLLGI